jgi:hypothetical protein
VAPTAKQIIDFIEKHPGFTAHGYATAPRRSDYRISLEGVKFIGPYDDKTKADFLELFQRPSQLIIEDEKLYCWYD